MTNIHVTEYGADPSGFHDSTGAVRAALAEARRCRGPVVLDFAKGEYHFYKDGAVERELYTSNTSTMEYPVKWISILLEKQSDVTIDGNGSVFVFHGDVMAIAVIAGANINLKNLSIDYRDADTVDISVIGHGEEQDTVYTDFYIPACYRYCISDNRKHITWYGDLSKKDGKSYWQASDTMDAYLVIYKGYDGTVRRHEERGVDGEKLSDPFRGITLIEDLGNRILRFHYKETRPQNQELGNLFLLCDSRTRKTAGVCFWESRDIEIEHVQVHYLSGFGWLIQMCENIRFHSTHFLPRQGAGKMTTSNADQIHAAGIKGYFEAIDCKFAMSHDDPINIHGSYMRVEEILDPKTLRLKYIHRQQGGFRQFHKGDEVLFYNRTCLHVPDGMKESSPAVVEDSFGPGEQYLDQILDRQTEIIILKDRLNDRILEALKRHVLVEAYGKYADEGLYVAENTTYAPSVVIRGCRFNSIPTRGILCTTNKPVIIEENKFCNISMAGIYLSNDAYYWYESGPIRNMQIRRNQFYIRSSGQNEWADAPGIFIDPVLLPQTYENKNDRQYEPVHKNISIEENHFVISNDNAVTAKSVEGIKICNNRIERERPEIATVFEKEIFSFENCKQVLVSDNQYDEGLNLHVKVSGNYMMREDICLKDTLLHYAEEPGTSEYAGEESTCSIAKSSYLNSDLSPFVKWDLQGVEPPSAIKAGTDSYFFEVNKECFNMTLNMYAPETSQIKVEKLFCDESIMHSNSSTEKFCFELTLNTGMNMFQATIIEREKVQRQIRFILFRKGYQNAEVTAIEINEEPIDLFAQGAEYEVHMTAKQAEHFHIRVTPRKNQRQHIGIMLDNKFVEAGEAAACLKSGHHKMSVRCRADDLWTVNYYIINVHVKG